MSTKYPLLETLIHGSKGTKPLGVVFPLSEPALETVTQLREYSLCAPILIGPQEQITFLARKMGVDIDGIQIIDTPNDPVAAATIAVAMAKAGELAALMKGSLHTEDLMGPVVGKDGLRTARRTSHLFLFELSSYHKLIGISDCVVNIAPTAEHKKHILLNSLDALAKLGVAQPKVAILAATEVVNPAMQATLDAKLLVDAQRDAPFFPGALIEGPFGFDNAISATSAKTKGIQSVVSGDPDLLLAPDLQAGNILYKSLVYMAGAECAGAILGAAVPIILTSRSDSVFSRVASTALAMRLA
ncbi:MAG: bifunctional enoyl-CoA hydratase/phosphate acetyltransferase [Polynucleobacter sp.]|nr:bifunctional enoyl-CoA hydratase/phosphate acetyltransferase [Polynucleobacter sp.]MDZ4057177.1 bifunctional enoyl-CoA hydratase/phosphate acetyltransferase [Polynucleobacter sp.]